MKFLARYWLPISVLLSIGYSVYYYTWIWMPGGLNDPTPRTVGGFVYAICTIYGGLVGLVLLLTSVKEEHTPENDYIGNSLYKKSDYDKSRDKASDKGKAKG